MEKPLEKIELMKILGDNVKVRNLWIKVYDDEREKEGLISLEELIESFLEEIFKNRKIKKKNE